ncbi:MAG: hypothetical protein R3F43_31835 [bacterium]
MIRLAALIGLAAVAGGSSCGSESGRADRVAADRCQASLPCPGSLTCLEGACVGAEVPDWPLTLRVRPPTRLALAAIELAAVEVPAP